MGRIRTIKPELLEDQRTASLTDAQWRLFVSLILLADDYGNLRANPIQIAGSVFWGSDPTRATRGLLERLAEVGLVTLYEVAGQPYAHLNGWQKHQRVDRPGAPRCPPPTGSGDPLANDSRVPREECANDSREAREPLAKSEKASDYGSVVDFASPSRAIRESLATDQDQDQDQEREEERTRTTTQEVVVRWSAKDWFAKFKAAWVVSYAQLSYWGPTSDGRAVGDLEDALSQLRPADAIAAQERAPEMFAEFLAQDSRQIREARHPWSWFVQRFNGLRAPQRPEKSADRDIRRGHVAAPAADAPPFRKGAQKI